MRPNALYLSHYPSHSIANGPQLDHFAKEAKKLTKIHLHSMFMFIFILFLFRNCVLIKTMLLLKLFSYSDRAPTCRSSSFMLLNLSTYFSFLFLFFEKIIISFSIIFVQFVNLKNQRSKVLKQTNNYNKNIQKMS